MRIRKRGFTLIELLTVIVIIAILAAILFPVFARAREKARTIHCANNLKNLATALATYRSEHDGKYPLSYSWGPTYVTPATYAGRGPYTESYTYYSYTSPWPLALEPYLKAQLIFKCRSDGGDLPFSYAYNRNLGGTAWFPGCPGYVWVFSGWANTWAPTVDSPTAWSAGWSGGMYGVKFPSKTIAFCDAPNWDIPVGPPWPAEELGGETGRGGATQGGGYVFFLMDSTDPYWNATLYESWYDAATRHGGGANYAFCDGHAEYLRPDQVKMSTTKGPDGTLTDGTDTVDVDGGTDTFAADYNNWWPDGFEDIPGPDAPGTHPTFNIQF